MNKFGQFATKKDEAVGQVRYEKVATIAEALATGTLESAKFGAKREAESDQVRS